MGSSPRLVLLPEQIASATVLSMPSLSQRSLGEDMLWDRGIELDGVDHELGTAVVLERISKHGPFCNPSVLHLAR